MQMYFFFCRCSQQMFMSNKIYFIHLWAHTHIEYSVLNLAIPSTKVLLEFLRRSKISILVKLSSLHHCSKCAVRNGLLRFSSLYCCVFNRVSRDALLNQYSDTKLL